ncbi:CoxG family protein [Alteribacillus sp. YIM 98480]|uniref:CoxG family protein n=1 Tax=Alteribacillus sp. YIM 98480 TaxID=2606599 RepID=UPI00131DEC05|nr:carbon monoxide dehydrogenase subunit G [Alteribacillus sp. YIM 98480]
MKLQGKADFQAPKDLVWKVMNNTDSLKASTPGCKELIETEAGVYEASLEMGIAAIKGHYDGEIILSNKQPTDHMTLNIKAEGSAGIVEATAQLNFSETNSGTTIDYNGEGNVNGLIAGVGQRMLTGVAKMLVGQFFKSIDKEVKAVETNP